MFRGSGIKRDRSKAHRSHVHHVAGNTIGWQFADDARPNAPSLEPTRLAAGSSSEATIVTCRSAVARRATMRACWPHAREPWSGVTTMASKPASTSSACQRSRDTSGYVGRTEVSVECHHPLVMPNVKSTHRPGATPSISSRTPPSASRLRLEQVNAPGRLSHEARSRQRRYRSCLVQSLAPSDRAPDREEPS